eukprot:CAMPEP_0198225520 /NCGR_PEP_ID=MMETSP1445-20131203/101422_1 /TAXON_ID=36898 /ORGANISM="Pyramimonas sp., Strain CCMP2087" /LENGTH=534 /DNA_ID=CAMNT_0043905067 /DNA_START=263 /DNA_END=1867 /DNA_ORIENTATION=+
MEMDADLPVGYENIPQTPPTGRRAGVVLHPTSLPGPYGCGEIGHEAFKFIDWLDEAHIQVWQVLPLVPPGRPIPGLREAYWSPYSGEDANAGNTLLISLQSLVDMGLLPSADLPAESWSHDKCDWDYVTTVKDPLLYKAATTLLSGSHAALKTEFQAWAAAADTAAWLEPAALFAVLCQRADLLGKNWWEWPADLRDMEPAAMAKVKEACASELEAYKVLQWLFDKQWSEVKAYANSKGIKMLGDMPIYVGGQSADVWANRALFTLKSDGTAEAVAGVPPDMFSADGQLWGNPLYDWQAHEKEGFAWWTRRVRRSLSLYDETRIDHFRGLAGYWAVPGTATTAKTGSWKVGPGVKLFEALEKNLGHVPIIAEDLGVITPDVNALRAEIGAPGMLVLQFAWEGGATNVHLPHNHYKQSIVYPGTHDNDTTVGWFASASDDAKKHFRQYTGMTDDSQVSWCMMRQGLSSVSDTCIICMQDVLSLDTSARFNSPGVADGNWGWRMGPRVLKEIDEETGKLRGLVRIFDRTPAQHRDD